MVVLGGEGGLFLMSEVPLYSLGSGLGACLRRRWSSRSTGETRASNLGGLCRANVAHIRQSQLDSGLGVQVKVRKPFKLSHIRLGAHLRRRWSSRSSGETRGSSGRLKGTGVWVVRVGGDDGELRPWHYMYVHSIESRLMMRVRYESGSSWNPKV